MTVRVIEWKPGKGSVKRWMVDVRVMHPDGTPDRNRKVIEGPQTRAQQWGDRRQAVMLGQIHAPRPEDMEPQAEARKVLTVAAWSERMPRYYQDAKPSARDTALGLLATHIVQHVGDLPLSGLTQSVKDELEATWRRGAYPEQNKRGREIKPTNSKKTLNNRRQVLMSLLDYAVACPEESGLMFLPCKIELAKVDTQKAPRFYDLKVYAKLVAAAQAMEDPRALAIVLLGGDIGLRGGEMMGLTWSDVDYRTGRITPRVNVYEKTVDARFDDDVKGGLEKPVPMSARVVKALRAVPRSHANVLVDETGKPLSWRQLTWIVQRVERAAGFPPKPTKGEPTPPGVVHFECGAVHVLRHTYISHLAMAGVPARTIQELARHSDLATTMKYMHLVADAKESAVKALAKLRS